MREHRFRHEANLGWRGSLPGRGRLRGTFEWRNQPDRGKVPAVSPNIPREDRERVDFRMRSDVEVRQA